MGEFFEQLQGRIRGGLTRLAAQERLHVLFVPGRADLMDLSFVRQFRHPAVRGFAVADPGEVVRQPDLAAEADLILVSGSITRGDIEALRRIRRSCFRGALAVWLHDNHHKPLLNHATCGLADVVFPSHGFCSRYLLSPHWILAGHVPLAFQQWDPRLVREIVLERAPRPRENGLHGGFFVYPRYPDRNRLLEQCRDLVPGNRLTLRDRNDRSDYFAQPPEQRIGEWAASKVCLHVPLWKDVTHRIFDALITGQIPLVPSDLPDLDHVISPEQQQSLPVLRFARDDAQAVTEAWREGLVRFDADGEDGVARRHHYAASRHTVLHRLQLIVDRMLDLGRGQTLSQLSSGLYRGWFAGSSAGDAPGRQEPALW